MIPESTILLYTLRQFRLGTMDSTRVHLWNICVQCDSCRQIPRKTLDQPWNGPPTPGIQEPKPEAHTQVRRVGIWTEEYGLIVHLRLQKFARQADKCGPGLGCGQILSL